MRLVTHEHISYLDPRKRRRADLKVIPSMGQRFADLILDICEDREQRRRTREASARRQSIFDGEIARYRANPASPMLEQLQIVIELRSILDDYELEVAQAARLEGASWAQLGKAAGLARSSAKSRYDHRSVYSRRQSFRDKKQPSAD